MGYRAPLGRYDLDAVTPHPTVALEEAMLAYFQISKAPFARLTRFIRAKADPVAVAQPETRGNGLG
jgi:hypothetical protein